jgi:hypothetical protein
MVSVYVSYAWKEEEQNRLVDKLGEACAAREIELLRDREQIGYGDSILQFMKEIGAGGHVVLVLSEAYFKSEYCMYELRQIYENRDFRKRVYPIVLSGTPFHKPIDRIPYIEYWQTETAKLEAALARLTDPKYTLKLREALDGYAEFRRLMDELQSILADMNTLTEEEHLGTDFAALLDRIAPDDFRTKITDEVRNILATSTRLSNALESTLRDAKIEPSADLAASLCAVGPERALGDLLFPATRSTLTLLDPRQSEFADTWDVAKSVLAWLSLLAVNSESLGQAAKNALSAGKLGFEIVVETPLGVELVSSRYHRIAPRLHAQKGKKDVVGEELIPEPQYETGWGEEAALDKLVLEVWARVFPEESRATLSKSDLRTLNSALRFREKQKTHHHYIPVPVEQASRLCRPVFYQKLLDKLPAISVIFFKPSGGTPALLVSDEVDFMTIIREFLTIPELLGKRP